MAMGGFEILLSICFITPLIYKPWGFLAPVAAVFIVTEMLLFIALHLNSGDSTLSPVVYWLVIAVICGFIAFGRFMLVG